MKITPDTIETILARPGDSELPENIAEIEKAIFKYRFCNPDWDSGCDPLESVSTFREVLNWAGITLDWDLADLLPKIIERRDLALWDFSYIQEEADERYRAIYARMRDRPQIAKLEALYGVFEGLLRIAENTERIETEAREAQDYSKTVSFVLNGRWSCLAFIIHASERLGVEVSTESQLKKLPGITNKDKDRLKRILVGAKVDRYELAIKKALKDKARPPSPKDFGLGETWEDPYDGETSNRDESIKWILRRDYGLRDCGIHRVYIRDVAEETGLTFSEVVKASRGLQDGY